jgi:hypothetical protein
VRDKWMETDRRFGEHAEKAITSLADIPVRELEAAAAAALERRGDTGDWHFYRVFEEVATACRSGRNVSNTEARYRLCRAIERLDDGMWSGWAGRRRRSGCTCARRRWCIRTLHRKGRASLDRISAPNEIGQK